MSKIISLKARFSGRVKILKTEVYVLYQKRRSFYVINDLQKLRRIHLNRERHEPVELVAMLIGCSIEQHFDEGLGVQKDLQVSPLPIVS